MARRTRRTFAAFHWHGDHVTLPRGATRLASSRLSRVQAFRYGRNAHGILFHMEMTARMVRRMVRTFPGDLSRAGVSGSEIVGKTGACLPPLERIGDTVFGRWVDLVREEG